LTWFNNDTGTANTAHTVTVKTQPADGNWPVGGSGNLPYNQSYSFTFTVPGTYTYYCTYHAWMTGTIVVKAATTPSPEFPAASLAIILFAVIAVVMVVAPRLKPALSAGSASGTAPAHTLSGA
jgi:Copper binding proteins, plastocyanin/azurin family